MPPHNPTFVYVGGKAIAEQVVSDSVGTPPQKLKWKRRDPAQTSLHLHDDWNLPSSTGGIVQFRSYCYTGTAKT